MDPSLLASLRALAKDYDELAAQRKLRTQLEAEKTELSPIELLEVKEIVGHFKWCGHVGKYQRRPTLESPPTKLLHIRYQCADPRVTQFMLTTNKEFGGPDFQHSVKTIGLFRFPVKYEKVYESHINGLRYVPGLTRNTFYSFILVAQSESIAEKMTRPRFNEECPICLEDLVPDQEERLLCGHACCSSCTAKIQEVQSREILCPLCNTYSV